VVLAHQGGDVEQTCCAEGFLGLTVEFVVDTVAGRELVRQARRIVFIDLVKTV
jgi:hypothetical protein